MSKGWRGDSIFIEHRLEIQRPEVRTPVRSTRTICGSFSVSKCCADSLSVCPTLVCINYSRIRMTTYARLRSCSPCQSLVDYGNMKTLHTGEEKKKEKKGSAVLWLLAFPVESSPNFPCTALEFSNLIQYSVYNWCEIYISCLWLEKKSTIVD